MKRIFLINAVKIFIYQNQLLLLFWGNGVEVSYIKLLSAISASYLLISISPGTLIGDLSVKSASTILFMSLLGYESDIILMANLLLWLLNIAIPALVGNLVLVTNKTELENTTSLHQIRKKLEGLMIKDAS